MCQISWQTIWTWRVSEEQKISFSEDEDRDCEVQQVWGDENPADDENPAQTEDQSLFYEDRSVVN